VRYIFLSDLLIETMRDEEIEAVFAHEIGHVVHRHLWWYVLFTVGLVLFSMGPLGLALSYVPGLVIYTNTPEAQQLAIEAWREQIAAAFVLGTFVVAFGYLSRRFERQADVYAARMMEAARPADPADGAAALAPLIGGPLDPADRRDRERAAAADRARRTPVESHVGAYGANLFASALHRVATINNMPVTPRSRQGTGLVNHVSYAIGSLTDLAHDWLHGSIPSRMDYLRSLSEDPARTGQFDRVMGRLYGAMLFVLIASAAYSLPILVR
jgi:STE24 endopeptidase